MDGPNGSIANPIDAQVRIDNNGARKMPTIFLTYLGHIQQFNNLRYIHCPCCRKALVCIQHHRIDVLGWRNFFHFRRNSSNICILRLAYLNFIFRMNEKKNEFVNFINSNSRKF